jgi:DNA polymerase
VTKLSIDLETRSRCDLLTNGLHAYSRDPSSRVLIFCYALDDGAVSTWLPHEQKKAPADLKDAITDPAVEKWAFNAPFEQNMIKHTLGLNVVNWRDTMIQALYASLPASLEYAGKALGLPEEMLKNPEGKKLIRLFSIPRKDGGFNDWNSHPEEFEKFVRYCQQDVEAERAIRNKLAKLPVPESEWALWELDQEINQRGIPVDLQFVEQAIRIGAVEKQRLVNILMKETGLPNPMTQAAFLGWARDLGYPYGDLRKATVENTLREGSVSGKLAEMLSLRSQAAKTSMSKFDTIKAMTQQGRIYNSVQFYGASRTGRWAGRGVQIQNLPRPIREVEDNEQRVTDMVKAAAYDDILMEFGGAIPVVSSVIRSSFRAREGHTFYAADLNAIENRVLGWVSDCPAILDVFRNDRDPYKDFGSRMFHKPYEEITKPERTLSKPAVLGCGYMLGGGEETVNKNGDTIRLGLWGYAGAMGIDMSREQAHEAVKVFRAAYPEVVSCWYALKDAAFECVQNHTTIRVGPLVFNGAPGLMRVKLPSGRILNYLRPRIEKKRREFKRLLPDGTTITETKLVDVLSYDGTDQVTKQWGRVSTHPGKLMENFVQAIARDILAAGLVEAKRVGFDIVMHVHDEIVAEVPFTSMLTPEDLAKAMSVPLPWAPDLPLKAEAIQTPIYKK